MSINMAYLMGNLGARPEIIHLPSGSLRANFSVATNEYGETKPEWHRVVIESQNIINRIIVHWDTGDKVVIRGRLRTRQYQRANEDSLRDITEVVVGVDGHVHRETIANRLEVDDSVPF